MSRDTYRMVSDWLTGQRGKGYCDHCIAERLHLHRGRRAVWRATNTLAKGTGFRREKMDCPACGRKRLVIQVV